MIKIFAKILLFALPSLIAVIITANQFSHGFIDYHYSKITGEGKSLIIGTSRASQGLIPEIIMQGTTFESPLLNYAFTSYNSPYNKEYYRAIEKKLDPSAQNGIFILEIDPMALSDNENEKAPSHLLSQQYIFHGDPNYEYLYRNVNPFYTLILKNNEGNPNCVPHKNGWLEISLHETPAQTTERANGKLTTMKKEINHCTISDEKVEWLKKTIDLLKAHGKVYLIRIPAWQPIIDAENKGFPNLNEILNEISTTQEVPYLDYSTFALKYSYIDGNHLNEESSKLFSKELNHLILSH
jgi:hypothetical protein